MTRRLATAVLSSVLAVARLGWAGATTPTLAISAASGISGDARRTVVLETGWDYANGVQVPYALEIVVFQGTRFVRYPIDGTPVTGTSALLADGRLDPADVPAFLADGAAAPADVRIVTLVPGEAQVSLPADFTAGAATAVLFAVLPDRNAFSNPLALVLP